MDKTQTFAAFFAVILVLVTFMYFFSNNSNKKSPPAAVSIQQQEDKSINNQKESQTQAQNKKQEPKVKEQKLKTEANKQHTMTQAIIKTNQGDIVLELFADDAPKTVENFTKLANQGFYAGTKFHRVIKGFMIQGGDPLTKNDSEQARWGTGGPGYAFEDEIHANNKNEAGTIAMANSGPNTNGSQFFINVANNDFLNTKHTVFGRVIDGMDVVAEIENTQTAAGDRPVESMVIESIIIK